MNSHLLPFPYNQSKPPSWLERVTQPLSSVLLGEPKRPTQQELPRTPIPLQNHGDSLSPIRIICISDTHNKTPPLPPGDILVHAGDLTVHGTFDEVQAQLRWLSSQPHSHKIVIAGNHDILLDEASDTKFLTRGGDSAAERQKLDWGGVQYLQNEAITLELPIPGRTSQQARKVKIYGSPLTPELGSWAFQYPPIRDVWTGQVPNDTDILIVHGPPALYGDCDGEKGTTGIVKVKGDGYLLREIRRVRPKVVICGHTHGAYGLAVIQHDGIQDVMDGLQMRWKGYGFLEALGRTLRSKVTTRRNIDSRKETLVINAAVAPSSLESKDKRAIAIDFH
ncbi:Calcineurin-like phosphoesterase [Aspergillus sclerotialis]|uniref:Calcineurin-like phosphoesterase n=1 Tax=Aspergillus sclerotialis TaxID=2070753 RepID=A0A3A2ZT01_9EURO|nr:Calcineurin-like phosphoesterase [Aspergillus sclerotialis]